MASPIRTRFLTAADMDDTTAEIIDLVAAAAASALGSRLHPRSAKGLAKLVRET